MCISCAVDKKKPGVENDRGGTLLLKVVSNSFCFNLQSVDSFISKMVRLYMKYCTWDNIIYPWTNTGILQSYYYYHHNNIIPFGVFPFQVKMKSMFAIGFTFTALMGMFNSMYVQFIRIDFTLFNINVTHNFWAKLMFVYHHQRPSNLLT